MNIAIPLELDRARESCRHRAWVEAYEALSLIDRAIPLEVEDLERLAVCAYLIGRDDDYLRALERAHHIHLEAGQNLRAIRCAFWIGLRLMFRREVGPATGWFARAGRLLEQEALDCVETGYLMLPVVHRHLATGNWRGAFDTASGAAAIGTRFGEPDLVACALHLQGLAGLRQGSYEEGLGLLDEAMVAVTSGELSPIFTGLIYCNVIEGCRKAYALERAREWTVALARWCGEQPQMVAFTDRCLVHRSEVMQLQGAWRDAVDEAQRVCVRVSERSDRTATASAYYQKAELHRLRGEFGAAEECYQIAAQSGREPQPGLALLRLTQGRVDAAAAAIERLLMALEEPFERARLLPAHIEIQLALGEDEGARKACTELETISHDIPASVLGAMAAHARGALELASGDAAAALGPLRKARLAWQQIGAPYESARVHVQMGLACRALGDEEGADMELDAARRTFEHLGALPDLARLGSLHVIADTNGLTARELQVLRMVATGDTNKAIAGELALSVKTVDRHLENIFNKLGVASRAAATAHAYQHKLL